MRNALDELLAERTLNLCGAQLLDLYDRGNVSLWLPQLIQRAYENSTITLHENGFIKIVLSENDETSNRLRLHVWDNTEHIPHFGDIHNHTRDFSSLVIAGELYVEEYVFDPSGNPYFHYIGNNRTAHRAYDFAPAGSEKLRCSSAQTIAPGSMHSLDFRQYHRVKPAGGAITASLFLQGPEQQAETDIFSPKSKADVAAPKALPIADDLRRLLARVVHVVSANQHPDSR